MRVILMTGNRKKVPEFAAFLGRHNLRVERRPFTEDPAQLRAWLGERGVAAVLKDESNLYTPDGWIVDAEWTGPALNLGRLEAWVLRDGAMERRFYAAAVEGHVEGARYRPQEAAVFDWDDAFTPAGLEQTYHQMRAAEMKTSAREQVLSAFARDVLWYDAPKRLNWFPAEQAGVVDLRRSAADFVRECPLLKPDLLGPLEPAVRAAVQAGLFFRSSVCPREKVYWWPGLNGGIPYTPKKDAVHEVTYLVHDLFHHLMPDLVFTGGSSPAHRQAYLLWRMLSEAFSLVLADMRYVHRLASAGIDYDWSARKIYPLYLTLRDRSLPDLLRAMARYVLLGEDDGLATPDNAEPLAAFESKYAGFFTADYRWTAHNWSSLLRRSGSLSRWAAFAGDDTFARFGLTSLGAVAAELDALGDLDARIEAVCERGILRIQSALAHDKPLDPAAATATAARRYLLGQLAIFFRYEPIAGLPPLAEEMLRVVRAEGPIDLDEVDALRAELRGYLDGLVKRSAISADDAAVFREVYPLFDPYFVSYEREKLDLRLLSREILGDPQWTPPPAPPRRPAT